MKANILMSLYESLQSLLDNFFGTMLPQNVLTSVGEYFLWCTIVHIYFMKDEICDRIFCGLWYGLRNWPARSIVNRGENPLIPIVRFRQSAERSLPHL